MSSSSDTLLMVGLGVAAYYFWQKSQSGASAAVPAAASSQTQTSRQSQALETGTNPLLAPVTPSATQSPATPVISTQTPAPIVNPLPVTPVSSAGPVGTTAPTAPAITPQPFITPSGSLVTPAPLPAVNPAYTAPLYSAYQGSTPPVLTASALPAGTDTTPVNAYGYIGPPAADVYQGLKNFAVGYAYTLTYGHDNLGNPVFPVYMLVEKLNSIANTNFAVNYDTTTMTVDTFWSTIGKQLLQTMGVSGLGALGYARRPAIFVQRSAWAV